MFTPLRFRTPLLVRELLYVLRGVLPPEPPFTKRQRAFAALPIDLHQQTLRDVPQRRHAPRDVKRRFLSPLL